MKVLGILFIVFVLVLMFTVVFAIEGGLNQVLPFFGTIVYGFSALMMLVYLIHYLWTRRKDNEEV
jgi:hypothetical protein